MKLIKCSPEAREKCKFDHPCDSEEKAFFEEGSPCDAFNKSLLTTPTPTNAQRIRAMSDEELAVEIHAYNLHYAPWCDYHCENEGDDGCDRCIANWLQQPCGGADHDKS